MPASGLDSASDMAMTSGRESASSAGLQSVFRLLRSKRGQPGGGDWVKDDTYIHKLVDGIAEKLGKDHTFLERWGIQVSS